MSALCIASRFVFVGSGTRRVHWNQASHQGLASCAQVSRGPAGVPCGGYAPPRDHVRPGSVLCIGISLVPALTLTIWQTNCWIGPEVNYIAWQVWAFMYLAQLTVHLVLCVRCRFNDNYLCNDRRRTTKSTSPPSARPGTCPFKV